MTVAALGISMAAGHARADEARPISCGAGSRSWLVPFAASPFPFRGTMPDGRPFLDKDPDGDNPGHTSPRGGVYRERPTYADQRVLLSVPAAFDRSRLPVIVLFLHGNLATIEREVCRRQAVPQQVAASGLNAVLVAPQLAVNALDSSAGHFWDEGFTAKFLAEAAWHLGKLGYPDLGSAPVVIAAYSGGYLPAVYAAQFGSLDERLEAILLLDALFGEVDMYARVIADQRPTFVSAYSASSREPNTRLRALLSKDIAIGEGLSATIGRRSVTFLSTNASHAEFVTSPIDKQPLLAALLRRLRPGAGR